MTTRKIVILGTGGTIAGLAASSDDNLGYTAAQLGVNQLVAAVPGLSLLDGVVCEQVAQIDSKDMTFKVWTELATRVQHHLIQDDVSGVVITHGTDTLEETAYFLQAVLHPLKPVVLTCAMRPATATAPDGPQNILDAVGVARLPDAQGVVMVCAGVVHSAQYVQKVHTMQLDAFSSSDAGAIGLMHNNTFKLLSNWPVADINSAQAAPENIAKLRQVSAWPQVDIVMNYAGVSGELVDALVGLGAHGLIVAGTGNGTVHQVLQAALLKAQARGVHIVRATRCVAGPVLARVDDCFPTSDGLSPVKARIAMMLRLMDIGA